MNKTGSLTTVSTLVSPLLRGEKRVVRVSVPHEPIMTIAGTAHDPDGNLFTGNVLVTAYSENGGAITRQTSEGFFDFGEVALGQYSIAAELIESSLYSPSNLVQIWGGCDDLELRLTRPGLIEVKLTGSIDKEWRVIVGNEGGGQWTELTTDQREFKVSPLAPGRYTVIVSGEDSLGTAYDVVVTEGGRLPILEMQLIAAGALNLISTDTKYTGVTIRQNGDLVGQVAFHRSTRLVVPPGLVDVEYHVLGGIEEMKTVSVYVSADDETEVFLE